MGTNFQISKISGISRKRNFHPKFPPEETEIFLEKIAPRGLKKFLPKKQQISPKP